MQNIYGLGLRGLQSSQNIKTGDMFNIILSVIVFCSNVDTLKTFYVLIDPIFSVTLIRYPQ